MQLKGGSKLKQYNRSIKESLELLTSFRLEQKDPDSFYGLLAVDGIKMLDNFVPLNNKTVLDIGGGAGYFSAALRAYGANCYVVEPFMSELYWRGTAPENAICGDGYCLPFRDKSIDVAFSSNVLEHVERPFEFVKELIRITKRGGTVFFCFTNWYSPWGGHETSPWHFIGGEYALKRYETKYRKDVKNVYNESLFKIHVGTVLREIKKLDSVEIVDTSPRYLPKFGKIVLKMPIIREVITWNLAVTLRVK